MSDLVLVKRGCKQCKALAGEIARLKSENERLREALEKIAQTTHMLCGDSARYIAAEALK